jgi:hypothetical protein
VLSLQASLRPHEDLQIILDRRRDRASTEALSDAGEPLVERRRHHHVDLALKRNGFAIVPASPIEPVPPLAFDDSDAAEREQLTEIVSFTRRRRARRLWIVAAPVAFVLAMFMLMPPVDSLLHRILPEAPPPSKLLNGLPAVVQAPLITGIPAELPRDPRPESPAPDREFTNALRPGNAAAPADSQSRSGGYGRPGSIGGTARALPAREHRMDTHAAWMPELTDRLIGHAKAAERLATRTASRTKVWLVNGSARPPRPIPVEGPMERAQGP